MAAASDPTAPPGGPAAEVLLWRHRILDGLLATLAVAAFVAYVPGVWLSVVNGLTAIAVLDTVAYAFVVFLAVWRRGPFAFRAWATLAVGYALGAALLVVLGPFGAGYLWLFAVPVMAGGLLGIRAGVLATLLNLATLALVGAAAASGALPWSRSFAPAGFAVIAASFVTLNAVTAVCIGAIVRGLESTVGRLAAEIEERRAAEGARAALEKELLQARKLEAVGTLAGGIAHDFNNILQALLGHAAMARVRIDPGSPAARHLEGVVTAAERARDVVSGMLSFSRRSEPAVRAIDLAAAVQEDLGLIRASIPATIHIRFDPGPDRVVVEADPVQLQQVLLNLCTNAAQAMKETGGRLLVAVAVEDGAARLRVQDTGPGIPPELLDRIFEPYFTTRPHGGGTGLGLAIVHGIVASHGGTVAVQSEPGQGARFDIRLPLSTRLPAAADGAASGPAAAGRGGARVLLVDDEPSLVEVGCDVLEHLGYRPRGCCDPLEALALVEADPSAFDLVVTDLTMPGLTGDQLAARLVAIRPDLPIVLATGFEAALTPEAARRVGIRALVRKPLDLKGLAQVVAEALGPPVSAGPS